MIKIMSKKAIITLIITFITSFVLLVANCVFSVSAQVITPDKTDHVMTLSLSYSDNTLTAEVLGGSESFVYQYWIKTKVDTDDEANLKNKQYIWKLARGYNLSATAPIPVNPNSLDEKGNYSIIARIKDSSEDFIAELYGVFSPTDLGQPLISLISVNGKAVYNDYLVVQKGNSLNVNVAANLQGLTYNLYRGEQLISETSETGNFALNINDFNAGLHKFSVEAIKNSQERVKQDFSLYIYDVYEANKIPVIKSLTGSNKGAGLTEFLMQVQYADGSTILDEHKDNFNFNLSSGGIKGTVIGKVVEGDMLNVTFSVNYNNKHGIYYTLGTVSRKDNSREDDRIIKYYEGFARDSGLSQTANKYSTTVSDTLIITAENGYIDGVSSQNLRYAFYREDASGWIMMRDYSVSNELTWAPSRAGTYLIQARIKDVNAGSWEKTSTRTYEIIDEKLTGTLDVNILDYQSREPIEGFMAAGRPYILNAVYSDSTNEEVLYMFTLTSANLGTVYLNRYTTSPQIMFVPNRADNYIITARAISTGNFGYKDISTTISAESKIITVLPVEISLNDSLIMVEGDTYDIAFSVDTDIEYTTSYSIKSGGSIILNNNTITAIGQGVSVVTVSVLSANANYLFTASKDITVTVYSDSQVNGFITSFNTNSNFTTGATNITTRNYTVGEGAAINKTGSYYAIFNNSDNVQESYISYDIPLLKAGLYCLDMNFIVYNYSGQNPFEFIKLKLITNSGMQEATVNYTLGTAYQGANIRKYYFVVEETSPATFVYTARRTSNFVSLNNFTQDQIRSFAFTYIDWANGFTVDESIEVTKTFSKNINYSSTIDSSLYDVSFSTQDVDIISLTGNTVTGLIPGSATITFTVTAKGDPSIIHYTKDIAVTINEIDYSQMFETETEISVSIDADVTLEVITELSSSMYDYIFTTSETEKFTLAGDTVTGVAEGSGIVTLTVTEKGNAAVIYYTANITITVTAEVQLAPAVLTSQVVTFNSHSVFTSTHPNTNVWTQSNAHTYLTLGRYSLYVGSTAVSHYMQYNIGSVNQGLYKFTVDFHMSQRDGKVTHENLVYEFILGTGQIITYTINKSEMAINTRYIKTFEFAVPENTTMIFKYTEYKNVTVSTAGWDTGVYSFNLSPGTV